MVILILGSILIWGRGFCGWVCHMRGAIEFADWILRKLNVRQYLNLRYGQGAFCRILCPYAPMMVPLMNISPVQKKITRVAQCTGCRDCSNACDDNVLKDTAAPGVPQTDRLKPYEKRPWQPELVRKDGLLTNARHMQVFQPLGPVAPLLFQSAHLFPHNGF